jgi:hypothetical protein
LLGRADDCPEITAWIPSPDGKFRDVAEKRLGLIHAIPRAEEVNAIGLFSIDCADGSDQVVAHD